MRGRYYLKHMISHEINNRNRQKQLNSNYKKVISENAISYLRSTNVSIDDKLNYINKLKTDLYRYGSKYKYDCHLSSWEIHEIIDATNDNNLYKAYYHTDKVNKHREYSNEEILMYVFLFVVMSMMFFACTSVITN